MGLAVISSAIYHFCNEAAAHDDFDPLLVSQFLCLKLDKSPATLRDLVENLWILVAKRGHNAFESGLRISLLLGKHVLTKPGPSIASTCVGMTSLWALLALEAFCRVTFCGVLTLLCSSSRSSIPGGKVEASGHLQVIDNFLRFFWCQDEVLERAVCAVNALQVELHSLLRDSPSFLAIYSHEKSHVLDHIEINFGISYSDSLVSEELKKSLAA